MKKYLLLVVSAILLLASVVLPSTPRRADASSEEYAVYSAVITSMFSGDRVTSDTQTKIKPLVIVDLTTRDDSDQDGLDFRRMFPTLAEEVVHDYTAKNEEAVRLKDSFDLKAAMVRHGFTD